MARMTGGRALVEMLTRHGIDTLFALPGVQNDALFVALYDVGNAMRVIHPRHEQAAAYMAYGYARASGKVGAFAVVPGPGLLNTTAALATAWATNAPVLLGMTLRFRTVIVPSWDTSTLDVSAPRCAAPPMWNVRIVN